MVEAWLRGPIDGIDPYLMPAAHALVQSREDLARAVEGLGLEALQRRPGGAASLSFHLRHVAGSIDRLLPYARGEALDEAPEADVATLVTAAQAAIDVAVAQIRATPRESILDRRPVGRAGLPSTVLGLLFHVAEHTQRHTGQVITTAKVVRPPV